MASVRAKQALGPDRVVPAISCRSAASILRKALTVEFNGGIFGAVKGIFMENQLWADIAKNYYG